MQHLIIIFQKLILYTTVSSKSIRRILFYVIMTNLYIMKSNRFALCAWPGHTHRPLVSPWHCGAFKVNIIYIRYGIKIWVISGIYTICEDFLGFSIVNYWINIKTVYQKNKKKNKYKNKVRWTTRVSVSDAAMNVNCQV